LINAGIDVYNSVLNIPTGNVERTKRDAKLNGRTILMIVRRSWIYMIISWLIFLFAL